MEDRYVLVDGGLYAPGQGFFPKYTKGVWTGNNGSLVISAGLSNTSAVVPRILNPTEVVYVSIRSKDVK